MGEVTGLTLHQSIVGNDPLAAIEKLGQMLAGSGMFGCESDEQGQIVAMACLCEGSNPMDIKKRYHLIQGDLSMRYEAMLAEFYKRGGKVEWLHRDTEMVEARFTHPENGAFQLRITLKELMDSGVAMDRSGRNLKDNYKKHPRQMITARLIKEVLNLICPEIVCGVYTPEEISDYKGTNINGFVESETKAIETTAPARNTAPLIDTSTKPEPKPEDPGEVAKAVEAKVEDDSPEVKLSKNEDAVNSYLRGLKWVGKDQTWRDLGPRNKGKVFNRIDNFISTAVSIVANAEDKS